MGKPTIILSLVFAVSGYFLGVIAEATRDSGLAIYIASCGLKILFFLIAVLLAHFTSRSIRRKFNVTGIPGLRYVGWIMYGVAMVHWMLLFRWDFISTGNTRIPDGQINIGAAIFFIASMLMLAEAWNTSKTRS